MTKVSVDQDACIACGICSSTCSEVFEEDEQGKSQIVEEYRKDSPSEGEIPEDINCVEDAATNCPADAIKLNE